MRYKKSIAITSQGLPTLDFKVESDGETKEELDKAYNQLRDEALKEYLVLSAKLKR